MLRSGQEATDRNRIPCSQQLQEDSQKGAMKDAETENEQSKAIKEGTELGRSR